MLRMFFTHASRTSLLQDFAFYEVGCLGRLRTTLIVPVIETLIRFFTVAINAKDVPTSGTNATATDATARPTRSRQGDDPSQLSSTNTATATSIPPPTAATAAAELSQFEFPTLGFASPKARFRPRIFSFA
jgi:predicted RNA-binding Zn ribbon-like protein